MGKREDRKAWLASLKAGDEVAVIRGGEWVELRTLSIVGDHGIHWHSADRSAATRSVNSNGSISTSRGSARIEPVTDEHRAIVRDRENLGRIDRFRDWRGLTPDQRGRIVAILDEGKRAGE